MALNRSIRVRPGLMTAFRSAHASRDARHEAGAEVQDGERVVVSRGPTHRSSTAAEELQRSVSQGLETLMNTVNLASSADLGDFAEARRSILNYGLPDIAHRSIDEIGVNEIGREIGTALLAFETRLVAGSIAVSRDTTLDDAELKIRFVVRADLSCDPLNLPVEFVADLERDTGKITVSRR